MEENGHGIQVVKVLDDHSYHLDEKLLEKLLMQDEIKDLPVVVVSVAGAYRRGKSFLLNFFLRYLKSPIADREDGSWLGDESQPLTGFSWRSGIKRNTTGILLWSKPFIARLPSGENVAVLLMDTQGTFDNTSTVRDCSTIFALSTLISSVQIYNLSMNIQEDDLQHLQLFTAYGKMVKDQGSNSKAFQVLEFLVRDWQYPDEYPFGLEGGEKLLSEKLRITPGMNKELRELREHISTSFEKTSCFLLPHPGFLVLKSQFKGEISHIDPEFRAQLKNLTYSLFGPEKLLPKKMNGELVRARDLFSYFQTYMKLFNSNEIPNPTSIMKATVEAGLLSAVNESHEIYEKSMDAECGPTQLSVPASDIVDLHLKYKTLALATFTAKKKLGSEAEAEKFLKKLTDHLESRLPQFKLANMSKTQTAINVAKEAYEKAMRGISNGRPLCVHPTQLLDLHSKAVAASMNIFDAARKKASNKEDKEREAFQLSFEKQYSVLRLSNEQGNQMAVMTVRLEYWQKMEAKCKQDPPLSAAELKKEHENALSKALEDFDSRRNLPSSYSEDVYKFNLTKEIMNNFTSLKKINQSKNKELVKAAIETYKTYMSSAWDSTTYCLHPSDFENEHDTGKCQALAVLRPRKTCEDGFDSDDSDEKILIEVIIQHYMELKGINTSGNEKAVQEAYNLYVNLMDDFCRPTLFWLLVVPWIVNVINRGNVHQQSLQQALSSFYSKRRPSENTSSDPYLDTLKSNIERKAQDY